MNLIELDPEQRARTFLRRNYNGSISRHYTNEKRNEGETLNPVMNLIILACV